MPQFGQARFFGLGDSSEAGIPSYREQVSEGTRRDGAVSRLRYLARANYAYNYIWWLRTRSNDPAYVARAAEIERRLRQPLARFRRHSERADAFLKSDFHFESQMLDPELVAAFADDLESAGTYHDPYVEGFRYEGRPADAHHPFLYMDSKQLFSNPHFLEIAGNEDLIRFCREVLGPGAALTWAWSWISRPTSAPYQNQNWHRDCAEPLNFIRVFVPLQPIGGWDDGPTEIIPATSGLRSFYEVRRFGDGELAPIKTEHGAGIVLAEPGDVYFINTFALHRGTPPARQRGILSLLVSLGPSHRTPAIPRQRLRDLPPELRDRVAANRRFFRHLIG